MNKMRVNYIIQHFFLSIFLQNWEDKKMWARRDYFPPYFLYFLFSLLNQIMKNAIFHYIFLCIFSILPVFTPTKHTLGSKSSLSLPYEGVFCFCHSRDNKIIFRAYGVFFFGGIRGSNFLSPIMCNSCSFFLPTCLNGGTHRYLAKYVSLREGGFRFYPSK